MLYHRVFSNYMYIIISYIPACFAGDAVIGGLEGAMRRNSMTNLKEVNSHQLHTNFSTT